MSLVYRKLLRLSAAAKRQATTGQMMNLVSVDAMRLMEFMWNPHDWWASPSIIVANMCVLFYMVGYPAIVGGFMLLALGTFFSKGQKIEKLRWCQLLCDKIEFGISRGDYWGF